MLLIGSFPVSNIKYQQQYVLKKTTIWQLSFIVVLYTKAVKCLVCPNYSNKNRYGTLLCNYTTYVCKHLTEWAEYENCFIKQQCYLCATKLSELSGPVELTLIAGRNPTFDVNWNSIKRQILFGIWILRQGNKLRLISNVYSL